MPRFRCLKSRDRSIMVCLEREGLTHDRLRIRGLALSQSPAFCCVFVGLSLVFWFIGLALPSAFQPDKTFGYDKHLVGKMTSLNSFGCLFYPYLWGLLTTTRLGKSAYREVTAPSMIKKTSCDYIGIHIYNIYIRIAICNQG